MMPDFSQLLRDALKGSTRAQSIYGYRPHEKQSIFHASKAKGRVFIGGNRSGKTVAGSNEIVRAATGTDPYGKFPEPPLRLRAVTVDYKQGVLKIMLPELARWTPPSALVDGSWEKSWSKSEQTLRLNNGSEIEVLTYEQETEKHAGVSRHAVWFDEEAPEHIFNENMGRLIDTGGIWWMTLTPVEGIEWIYQLYHDVVVEGQDKGVFFVQVDSYDNNYISAAEIDALFLNLTDEEKLARTRGMFEQLGGKIYPMFSDKNLVRGVHPPPPWTRIQAMDHGTSNPTAWLWMAVSPENEILIYDEHYAADLTVSQHAAIVGERERKWGLPLYRVGDPAIRQRIAIGTLQGTSIIQEYAKHGIYIALANNDVSSRINRVRTYLGMRDGDPIKLYIDEERCPNLVSEMRRYRWAKWATPKMGATRNRKEEPVKKDDHAVDAAGYGVLAWAEWGLHVPETRRVDFTMGPKALPDKEISYDHDWSWNERDNVGSGNHPLGSHW